MDESIYGWWFPPNYAVHGAQVDLLINTLHWFMAALFVGWGAFFIYCLVRFRAREGTRALYEPIKGTVSKYLEVGVALFELLLLFGLSAPVWAQYKAAPTDDKDALVIRVAAEQFAWNFHYAGDDGKFGRTQLSLVSRSNPLGQDPGDPAGADDIVSVNQLHVPVNQKVVLHITSKDVIHSFFIPVLRLKQDAIPGTDVPIWFTATHTGQFELACAQLCGIGHYRMGGRVFIDTPAQYEAWLAEQRELLEEL